MEASKFLARRCVEPARIKSRVPAACRSPPHSEHFRERRRVRVEAVSWRSYGAREVARRRP